MLLATLATLAFMGASSVNLMLVIGAIAIGGVRGVDQRQARRHDRYAADDRALQRHGRRRGGGDRGGRAVSRRPKSNVVHLAIALIGGFIGAVSFSGSLIAFAKLQGLITKSVRFGGQKILNLAILLITVALGVMVVSGRAIRPAGRLSVFRVRAASRHRDDPADRRRRHARGDLAVQRPDRPRGRLRRFRARQRRHDHRRDRGRRGGHPADSTHGQGHESISRQRPVRELRRNLGGRRRRRGRHAKGHRGLGCRCDDGVFAKNHHRAGLWFGGRPSPAQGVGTRPNY